MIKEFTAEQIEDGIVQALTERTIEVIPGLLKLLAVKDPHRAQVIYDTLCLGIEISRARDGHDG